MSTPSKTQTTARAGFFDVAEWRPEDPAFWDSHKGFAIRTLIISMLALHLAFAVWFTWSAWWCACRVWASISPWISVSGCRAWRC